MRRYCWVLVAASLVAAGCADDDDERASSTAALTTTAAVVEPEATSSPSEATSGPSVPVASTATATSPGARAAPATTVAPGGGVEPSVAFTEVATVESPVDLAWREGDDALYVVEQDGRVVRASGGATTTVLDITDLTDADGERGLLGLAFDPAGDLAYVNYTDRDGWTIIAEYPVDADGTFRTGDEARLVLEIEQPYANHNGGDLTFGPDGMLYIGMGDGGSGGDPERRATDLRSLLGKMLRIDPTPSEGQPYSVPDDNPFVGQPDAAPEIWSTGVRNPWKFSFDRDTGDLWIADVGQNAIEEISVAPATAGVDAGRGLFFGWSAFEGDDPFNGDVDGSGHTPPFSTYSHDIGCSISGGVRTRGGPVPALVGWYVYADYCSGQVWAVEVTGEGGSLTPGRQVELGQLPAVTAVVDGPAGELYVLSKEGPVVRLDPV